MSDLKDRLLPAISGLNDLEHGGKTFCQHCDKALAPLARVFFNPTRFVFCSEKCTVRNAAEILQLNEVIQRDIADKKS